MKKGEEGLSGAENRMCKCAGDVRTRVVKGTAVCRMRGCDGEILREVMF